MPARWSDYFASSLMEGTPHLYTSAWLYESQYRVYPRLKSGVCERVGYIHTSIVRTFVQVVFSAQ